VRIAGRRAVDRETTVLSAASKSLLVVVSMADSVVSGGRNTFELR